MDERPRRIRKKYVVYDPKKHFPAALIIVDGTLAGSAETEPIGELYPKAEALCQKLQRSGIRVVLWSNRPAEEIAEWAQENELPYDAICYMPRPEAFCYVGNRAVVFQGQDMLDLADEIITLKAHWEG